MNYQKPLPLTPGDTIAILSPSSGAASLFPWVYDQGLTTLRQWGMRIKEYPTTRVTPEELRKHPEARARDVMAAFADPDVKAIITSIGGIDSVRILPFLKAHEIVGHPKIFMGYSDATTLHAFLQLQGMVSFYGPSVMAGFSQMGALPSVFADHVKMMLCSSDTGYQYQAYAAYCDGYPDWADPKTVGATRPLVPNDGWHWVQGVGTASGQLFGGCIEVLEMIKATEWWPTKDFWKGKILFFETSEEKPSLHYIDHVLRNYGMQGILSQISGLIMGRARDYTPEEKQRLERVVQSIVADEFGRPDLPIVANFDVGHTDPQVVLPLGVAMQIDCTEKTIKLTESWFA